MGSDVTLAQLGIPGILAITLLSTGMMGAAGQLVTEREDGTLLRAKAVPNGLAAHLMGNVLVIGAISFSPMLLFVLATTLAYRDATPRGAAGWLVFVGVCLLGLLATLPAGAVLGALVKNMATYGWLTLILYASIATGSSINGLNACRKRAPVAPSTTR